MTLQNGRYKQVLYWCFSFFILKSVNTSYVLYTRNTLASYSTLIKYSFIKTNASIYTGDIFLLKFHLHAYFMDTQKKKKKFCKTCCRTSQKFLNTNWKGDFPSPLNLNLTSTQTIFHFLVFDFADTKIDVF